MQSAKLKTIITNVERLKIMDIKTETLEEKEALDSVQRQCKCAKAIETEEVKQLKQKLNLALEALAISQEENKELKQQLESK